MSEWLKCALPCCPIVWPVIVRARWAQRLCCSPAIMLPRRQLGANAYQPRAPAPILLPAGGACYTISCSCCSKRQHPLEPCICYCAFSPGLFYCLLVVSAFADVALSHIARSDPQMTTIFRERLPLQSG